MEFHFKKITEILSPMDQSLLQNFIEWFAVIYSLVLSVIIGHAWKKYNNINNEIDREADSLVLLSQTGRMFKDDEDLIKALTLAIKRYVKYIILLQSTDCRKKRGSLEKLKDIRTFVELLIQKSQAVDCLKSDLLSQYNEI